MMAKLSSLMESTSDPMQDTLTALSSSFSDRLLHPRCPKERYHRSFYTAVILNTSFTTTAKEKKKVQGTQNIIIFSCLFIYQHVSDHPNLNTDQFFDSFWAFNTMNVYMLSYHFPKCYLEDLIYPQSHRTNDSQSLSKTSSRSELPLDVAVGKIQVIKDACT